MTLQCILSDLHCIAFYHIVCCSPALPSGLNGPHSEARWGRPRGPRVASPQEPEAGATSVLYDVRHLEKQLNFVISTNCI